MINDEQKSRFLRAIEIAKKRGRGDSGIGTYNEKSIHKVLKYFFEPDDSFHEIPLGNFIADIKRDNRIVEIQTSAFNNVRNRLDFFLQSNEVEIVYPIVGKKYLVWIDPGTGESEEPVLTHRKLKATTVLPELGRLGDLFNDSRLSVICVIIEAIEYRLKDGWGNGGKRGAHSIDHIPVSLIDMVTVSNANDILGIIPFEENGEFTSKEFAKACGFSHKSTRDISMALKFLRETGIIDKASKKGNSIIYRINRFDNCL